MHVSFKNIEYVYATYPRALLSASELNHLFVRLLVCLSVAKMQKKQLSQKLSNLELWSLLTTYRKSHMGFSKNPLLDP